MAFRLEPDQAAELKAIGRMQDLAQPVRTLAWLLTRYAEDLSTSQVARAVGVTPSSARYWRARFAQQGMSIFDRYLAGPGAAPSPSRRVVCVADLREGGGFDPRRVRYFEGIISQVFDALRDRHRLDEDSRAVLEKAVSYQDLGHDAFGFDDDGIFFTVLDPILQRGPIGDQRLLATVIRFAREPVKRKTLARTGLSRPDKSHALWLLAILKLALAVDATNTQRTRIRRIEESPRVFYMLLEGPEAATNAKAVEGGSRLWTRLSGQRGGAFAADNLVPAHEGVDAALYRRRPRSTGMSADDAAGVASRKVLRFQLVQMLKRENAAFIGEDPEGVHKMRVATRRIRAALKILGGSLPPGERKDFRKRFRRLGRCLGAVRDIDVLLIHVEEYRGMLDAAEKDALDPFVQYLRERWVESTAELRDLIKSRKYARLVAEFDTFTSQSAVGADGEPPRRARDAAPVDIYVGLAGVRAYEPRLAKAGINDLHRLRIEFKRLRYTVEFYQDILGEAAAGLIAEIKAAQDHLGLLQDAARAIELIDAYVADRGSDAASPTLIDYRERRAAEIPQRTDSFKDAWGGIVGPEFRRLVSRCVADL